MDSLRPVPTLLRIPVFLNILRMTLAIPLEIPWIFLQVRLNPGIIVFAVSGIVPPPSSIVVRFEGLLTWRVAAGLLPLAQLPVRPKRNGAYTTGFPLPLHRHPPDMVTTKKPEKPEESKD